MKVTNSHFVVSLQSKWVVVKIYLPETNEVLGDSKKTPGSNMTMKVARYSTSYVSSELNITETNAWKAKYNIPGKVLFFF